MIEQDKLQLTSATLFPTEEQLQTYVTISLKLVVELESITRQLKNANGRLHSVTEELNRLRASLKGKK